MDNKRLKICKACKSQFVQFSSIVTWCSPACGYELAKKKLDGETRKQQAIKRKIEKEQRAKLKERKSALLPKRWYEKKLKEELHAWIRNVRDAKQPCISCDKPYNYSGKDLGGGWDAGHYCSVGAHKEMQFIPENIHRQCKHCNTQGKGLGGNYVNYRIGLIKRYGQAYVDKLEGPQVMPKYTIDDLKKLIDHYKQLNKNAISNSIGEN